ncbi:S9 family peptidase [Salinibacter altiplanensis]|uniref:S9 family peptidase n=1 Tax=Salinibacter altiplanensis TaxID=1803181 RepID=UPI001E619F02|nr:prolyl oligopeptidase family serine peptidase [Salinibacter altiplanensis]
MPAPAQIPSGTERAIQAQDLYQMQEVTEVALSPRGRSVAYTVRHLASTGSAAPRTQLYVARTSGRDAPRLLSQASTVRAPAWHPEGTHLAFVRPVNGTPQVFVVPLDRSVPYQLTDTPHGAGTPQWGPEGNRLLFASHVPESTVQHKTGRPPPTERPGRAALDTVRAPAPDTLLVLRHTHTLDPLDTLAVDAEGRLRTPTDSTDTLRTPQLSSVPDTLAAPAVDRLAALSSDSLRATLDRFGLRPDTTTVAVRPDTAAAPDGNLAQVRRWMHQNRRSGTALVSSRLEIHGERQLQPTPTYRHHYVVDVPAGLRSGRPARPVPQPVTGGYRSYGQADWLPGGGQVVVSGMPATDRPPDRVRRRNLYVADLDRDRPRRLLRLEQYALSAPSVTTDGNTVAFQLKPLSALSDAPTEVGLFALNGRSQPRIVTSALDRDIASIEWGPDGWYLYATAPSEGGRPLFRFSPFAQDTTDEDPRAQRPSMSADRPTSRDTFTVDSTMVRPAEANQMTTAARAVHAFDVTDATAVYTSTDPTTPSALYANTVSFNDERPLARPNADWLAQRQVATPERITASHDSLTVTGWVTRPGAAADSTRHPLLVQARGGPLTLSAPYTPETWFERQYLAGRGLGLAEVFPQGSAGFGTAFRHANDQNWGPGPAQDVLALTDSVAARSWIDSTQVALAGTGYGGTLTAWLLGQTDRFTAGVALNGVYDLPALLDGGRAWRLVSQEFGEFPKEDVPPDSLADSVSAPDASPPDSTAPRSWTPLHRSSPLAYAHLIRTPLLLMQGGADRRVGPSQGERLYKRLKILDRPVEYVRYPGVGHDVSDSASSRQRLDRLVRTYEFLARFLDVPASPPANRP